MAKPANGHLGHLPADRRVPKVLLSIEETAWSMGVSEAKIYRLISERKLPVCRVGGNTLILPSDLEDFARKHRQSEDA
jgi:excisionase family DNA binding protein